MIGGVKHPDLYDGYLSSRMAEIMLMKNGINYSSIKQMSDREVQEYLIILDEINKMQEDVRNNI